MKKIISSLMLCSFISSTTISPVYASINSQPELIQVKKSSVEDAFKDFKKSVFLNGEDMSIATELLVNKLIDSKVTSGELELYVAKNSTAQGYKKFNELLDSSMEDASSLQDLGSDELGFILQSAMEKTHTTGSNFMSCAAGKQVGIPLIVVGVIMGIVAVVNATASKEVVTQEYIEKRRSNNQDYLNTVADLELEISTYESDIIYYGDEITELQRRIDSGQYSDQEVEEMYKLIRDYNFFISDSHALIGEVNVDLAYFENQYAADLATYEVEEQSALARVDEKRAAAGKIAIAAGIIGGVGSVFTVAGLSDCN